MARLFITFAFLVLLAPAAQPGGKDGGGVEVDKAKRLIKIDAKIAPRKLPHLKGEIYPIEVIACWPHPKGKKAHETVVTIDAKPSAVHKGLVALGLKPGKPVMGGDEVPKGPEVNLYLEFPGPDGATKKVSIDKTMVDMRNGKPFPKTVKWLFTGSVMSQADPTKPEKMFGADINGTLIAIFPVTDQTVLQGKLKFKDQDYLKLETNTKLLPKEGAAVKLVIEAPK
ncbi:MAG TPA: YdjY domain-containing protein [Gemmataceae bacterium]|nr:YdjY domain-containing protein [Gemmataceae bacterium]